jgi:molybdopterin synthase sulfur carrier subunit
MTVDILAFGIVKEMFGAGKISMEMPNTQTILELREMLSSKYPELKKLKSFMIAVNSDYATDDVIIKSGDEIAIIPPVSGG